MKTTWWWWWWWWLLLLFNFREIAWVQMVWVRGPWNVTWLRRMSGLRIRIEIDRFSLASCSADPEGPEARPACGWLGVIIVFPLVQTYPVSCLGDRRNHAGISIFVAPWGVEAPPHR